MHIMKELFARLKKEHLTINLAKCDFIHGTVEHLGHVLGQGCVRPIRAKVDAIVKYHVPTNKIELMRFLGIIGFYRRFYLFDLFDLGIEPGSIRFPTQARYHLYHRAFIMTSPRYTYLSSGVTSPNRSLWFLLFELDLWILRGYCTWPFMLVFH